MSVAVVIAVAIVIIFLLIVVGSSVRIVRPYQQGLVEQLGKYKETLEPGSAPDHPVRAGHACWWTCASRSSTCRPRR